MEIRDDSNQSEDPYLGTVIAERYVIRSRLGAGGMGRVYRAIQKDLDREVAVKVLSAIDPADEETIARFRREAELASAVIHPGIAKIFSFGSTNDGEPFIVMELLSGRSLADVLKERRKLSPAETRDLSRQLAETLSVLHERGIVHRDVKPENIIIEDEGTPTCLDSSGASSHENQRERAARARLADFGIARSADRSTLTASGALLGTPLYMSPEQCQGSAVDGKSDIYSLGCCTYQMLSGRTPFQGGSLLELFSKHMGDAPPALDHDVPEVDRELVYLCLSKDPILRPSAAELADYLRTGADKDSQSELAHDLASRRRQNQRRQRLRDVSSLLRRPTFLVMASAFAIAGFLMFLQQPISVGAWQKILEIEEAVLSNPRVAAAINWRMARLSENTDEADACRYYDEAVTLFRRTQRDLPIDLWLDQARFLKDKARLFPATVLYKRMMQQLDLAVSLERRGRGRQASQLIQLAATCLQNSSGAVPPEDAGSRRQAAKDIWHLYKQLRKAHQQEAAYLMLARWTDAWRASGNATELVADACRKIVEAGKSSDGKAMLTVMKSLNPKMLQSKGWERDECARQITQTFIKSDVNPQAAGVLLAMLECATDQSQSERDVSIAGPEGFPRQIFEVGRLLQVYLARLSRHGQDEWSDLIIRDYFLALKQPERMAAARPLLEALPREALRASPDKEGLQDTLEAAVKGTAGESFATAEWQNFLESVSPLWYYNIRAVRAACYPQQEEASLIIRQADSRALKANHGKDADYHRLLRNLAWMSHASGLEANYKRYLALYEASGGNLELFVRRVWHLRGKALRAKGKPEEAREYFRRALEFQERLPEDLNEHIRKALVKEPTRFRVKGDSDPKKDFSRRD